MKFFLPIIAITCLVLGCAPPKKTGRKPTNDKKVQLSQDPLIEKQFDVGTCSIILASPKIIEEDNSLWLTGTVEEIKGYGSSFPEILSLNQSLKIKINKLQANEIGEKKRVKCSISAVEMINNTTCFELIKFK
jgi:hypothetical protein